MPRGIQNSSTQAMGSSDDIEAMVQIPEFRGGDIDGSDIEVITSNVHDAAAVAKFMEEKVVVEIEASDDPNAALFVPLGHNGTMQYVERGKQQPIRRKYLYSALQAKVVKFASAFGKDNAGNEFNRLSPSTSNTHRIRLVRDDNPQGGMGWVSRVLQNA